MNDALHALNGLPCFGRLRRDSQSNRPDARTATEGDETLGDVLETLTGDEAALSRHIGRQPVPRTVGPRANPCLRIALASLRM